MQTHSKETIINSVKNKELVPFIQEYITFHNAAELSAFMEVMHKFNLNVLFMHDSYNYIMLAGKKEDIIAYLKYCDNTWDEANENGFNVTSEDIKLFDKMGITCNQYF